MLETREFLINSINFIVITRFPPLSELLSRYCRARTASIAGLARYRERRDER
jgi:hypothetical protein